ncbi:WAP-type 'four-disulfide core [Trichuris suis]|nr:WAP-type 'four-disulfide core [Trichuris suis]
MKISLMFPLLLLSMTILGTSKAAMHDLYCPPDDNYGEVSKHLCGTDDDCVKEERCCQSGPVVKCVRSWRHYEDVTDVKVGVCGMLTVRQKKIPPNCRAHQDCPGKGLCCEQRCIAQGAPAPKAKEGYCPSTTRLNVTVKECESDVTCPAKEKCCHFRSLITCVIPKAQMGGGPRKGKCPNKTTDDKPFENLKLCNGDSDCFYQDKCCKTSLTKRCMDVSPKPRKTWWKFN